MLYEDLRDNLIQIFNEIVEYYVYKGVSNGDPEAEKALIALKKKYDESIDFLNEIRDDNNYLKDENTDLKDQVAFLKDQIDRNMSHLINPDKKKKLEIDSFSYHPFGSAKSVN